MTDSRAERSRLGKEIAWVFSRLGVFGFGGPIATMAMMEEEAVRKRGWLTTAQFNEIYALCKLLPGPVSTQMAIYLGNQRGGWLGGVLAGVCFVLPSFLMVLGLSYFYVRSGVVHRAGPVLAGLQAGALALILVSTWGLARPYRKSLRSWAIVAWSGVMIYLLPSWEPLVILAAGLAGAWWVNRRARGLGLGGTTLMSIDPVLLGMVFWVCFKAGAFVFGTGLAVVPMLESDVVGRFGWLTHSQFMDGLAVGQVTPGPVVITSTFIGYMASGFTGAVVATLGMFLPSFVNVLVLVPRIWKRISGTPVAEGFSSFAIPAVIGGILGTTLSLGMMVLNGWAPAVVFVVALVAALWLKPPAWLLIPGAGVAGGLLGLV